MEDRRDTEPEEEGAEVGQEAVKPVDAHTAVADVSSSMPALWASRATDATSGGSRGRRLLAYVVYKLSSRCSPPCRRRKATP
jgi:hypothetical protein